PPPRQRPPHEAVAIEADEGHEGDGAVGGHVVGHPGQAGDRLGGGPVPPGQVIGDPEGQGEEVDEVDADGLPHLAILQEGQQGHQVARQPHTEHHAVHQRHQHKLHWVAPLTRPR
uniref:Uncharacterized protein n=1 Tax=Pelodiscus sinensis TaxID=13735 RepID=K7FY81_PELSI